MIFQYEVYSNSGVLVTTSPVLKDAMNYAKRFNGYVVKNGETIYRSKEIFKLDQKSGKK